MKRGRHSNTNTTARDRPNLLARQSLSTHFIYPNEYEPLAWGLEKRVATTLDKHERVTAKSALRILKCGERLCKRGGNYQIVLTPLELDLLASLAGGLHLDTCRERLKGG